MEGNKYFWTHTDSVHTSGDLGVVREPPPLLKQNGDLPMFSIGSKSPRSGRGSDLGTPASVAKDSVTVRTRVLESHRLQFKPQFPHLRAVYEY